MKKFKMYKHHNVPVWVQEKLKGKHREHCLCWFCARFYPEEIVENCPIAKHVFSLCVLEDLVLPVWECPDFIEKEKI